ncbi:MAG: ribosome biogenesis GTPase Der [Bacteroidales bacterium]
MSNIVAIVGRPNVGKSTLFNRLCGGRKAIVDEVSGVTRDRHYGKSDWNGKVFSLIDTGGYITNSEDVYEDEIRKQVLLAMEEADSVLFVVDVMSGITDLDESIASLLRKSRKKAMVVVNKVDNSLRYYDASVFYGLGLGEIYPVSAINGSGTGELLDTLVKDFSISADQVIFDDIPKFAIVGRPNAGKSSLTNALLGEDRNIVTPVAGTTRDAIYSRYNKFGHEFLLIDTAGLRKRGKSMENIEFYSIMRSVRAIENSDVCLLMLDAVRGMETQDVNIFNLIVRNKKGIVILVNKWDLIDKSTASVKDFTRVIKERISPFEDVPVIFTSALTRQRIHKTLQTAVEVFQRRKQRIPTSKLNEILRKAVDQFHPPAVKGKHVKINYVTQLPLAVPAFAFFCNLPQYIKDPYKRYLENRLRENFNFGGVPVQLFFRKK